MTSRARIIVMARYPLPGRVKTRLMPVIAPENCAAIQEAFVRHMLKRICSLGVDQVRLCVEPAERLADAAGLLADELKMLRAKVETSLNGQVSGDLGAKLAGAHQSGAFKGRTMLIGVDSPNLPRGHFQRLLGSAADVAIGPAEDGGFWGIALSSRVDSSTLFSQIAWSSGSERAQVLDRAKDLGYSTEQGQSWYDVDRPEDVWRLLRELRESAESSDRRLLEAMAFLPVDR